MAVAIEDHNSIDQRKRVVVDLATFMTHYNNVRDRLWPLGSLIEELKKIRRWENYPLSLAVVSVTCVSVLFPRAFFAALSGVLCILILAGNKYMLKSKYKKIEHTPVVPRLVVEDTEVLKSTANAQKERRKALNEYKQVVKRADDLLIDIAEFLDMLKSIFMWENERLSLCTCLVFFVLTFSTMWISVSTIMSVLLAVLFCWNGFFIKETKRLLKQLRNTLSRDHLARQISSNTLPIIRELVHVTNQSRETNNTLTTSNHREELISSGDSGNFNDRTVTSKREINCYKCYASFSLIKRKHPCNNCGHFFCSSCTVKVTRAALGATSPAAFQETVRVCSECKSELSTTIPTQS